MSEPPKCETCEFAPSLNEREPFTKRSKEEVQYGRLWAEVELPKLLSRKEPDNGENKQQ